MIPWPIITFIVVYAVMATVMAAEAWRAVQGHSGPPLALPLAWGAVCAALAFGLSFMRPWARRAAVWVSLLLMLAMLSSAFVAVLHVPPAPQAAVWGTLLAALQFVAVRYLTRPRVKAWFTNAVMR